MILKKWKSCSKLYCFYFFCSGLGEFLQREDSCLPSLLGISSTVHASPPSRPPSPGACGTRVLSRPLPRAPAGSADSTRRAPGRGCPCIYPTTESLQRAKLPPSGPPSLSCPRRSRSVTLSFRSTCTHQVSVCRGDGC